MKTFIPKKQDINQVWYLIDAKDKVLGRLATKIAAILRGKEKPLFTPHLDTGDSVVVINADKVKVTGNKEKTKVYFRHSGYPGGTTFETVAQVRSAKPERILESAVKGMLPHNKLGRALFRKLWIYAGETHPHEAQQPKPLEV